MNRQWLIQKLGLKGSWKWAWKKLKQGYILKNVGWGTKRIFLLNDKIYIRTWFEKELLYEEMNHIELYILSNQKLFETSLNYGIYPAALKEILEYPRVNGWEIRGKIKNGYNPLEGLKYFNRSKKQLFKEIKQAEKQYTYTCKCCGSRHNPIYNSKPIESNNVEYYDDPEISQMMVSNQICFRCAFWLRKLKLFPGGHLVIDGNLYYTGKSTLITVAQLSEALRSVFNSEWEPECILKGLNTGKVISIDKLWHNGEIPEGFRKFMPDTHEKLKKYD